MKPRLLLIGLGSLILSGVILLVAYMMWHTGRPKVGDTIIGRLDLVRTHDGDTIRLLGYPNEKLRLWGIDAPELNQTCKHEGKVWACGQVATKALLEFVQNDAVSCLIRSADTRYQRWVAVCSVRGIEINEWMVRHGWAFAYRSYSKHYVAQEETAKNEHLGVWIGTIEAPWDYRYEKGRKPK